MKFTLLGFLVALIGGASAFAPPPLKIGGAVVSQLAMSSDDSSSSALVMPEDANGPELPPDPAFQAAASIVAASAESSQKPYAGEAPALTPNTYVKPSNEALALNKERVPSPNHYAERQTKATTLTEIRAQQLQHGMHTMSNGIDYTRNVRRW